MQNLHVVVEFMCLVVEYANARRIRFVTLQHESLGERARYESHRIASMMRAAAPWAMIGI